MTKILTATALALLAGTTSLQAQLVETGRPTSTSKRPAAKRQANAPATLDRKLADYAITPRSLGIWKTARGVTFHEISFRKPEKPAFGSSEQSVDPKVFTANGLILNGFQIQGSDYLANAKESRPLALLRLNKDAPQVSRDGGHTWTDGEKTKQGWAFGFDGETLNILDADDPFHATEFKAWAFGKAKVVRTEASSRPYFHSAVVSVAYGKNEIRGLVKFPGSAFTITFKGIRFQDRWVARGLETQPLTATIFDAKGQENPNPGIGPLKTDERRFPQIELDEHHLLIGTGAYVTYGQGDGAADQLRSVIAFDLAEGRTLPGISASHEANLSRSLWSGSDDEDSFGREAERAYVQTAMPVLFFQPRRETGFEKGGLMSMKPMLDRIQHLGGKTDFIPLQ